MVEEVVDLTVKDLQHIPQIRLQRLEHQWVDECEYVEPWQVFASGKGSCADRLLSYLMIEHSHSHIQAHNLQMEWAKMWLLRYLVVAACLVYFTISLNGVIFIAGFFTSIALSVWQVVQAFKGAYEQERKCFERYNRWKQQLEDVADGPHLKLIT